MSKIHELASEVADLILSETESHQLLMPDVEVELTQQLTTADDADPIFSGCTGEHRARIKRLRQTILELSIAGVGAKAIAKNLSVSPQTVRAVRASAWQRGELDPLKQRLGREYLATADLLRAEALERIDEIPAHVLLLASAQSADKGQLLTGGPTQRIESKAVPADLNDLIDALPVVSSPVGSGESAAQKESEPVGALSLPDASQCNAIESKPSVAESEDGARMSRCMSTEVRT